MDSLAEFDLKEAIPYPTGKSMYLVESENADEVETIVLTALIDLKK